MVISTPSELLHANDSIVSQFSERAPRGDYRDRASRQTRNVTAVLNATVTDSGRV
jgi:hypothetical protein